MIVVDTTVVAHLLLPGSASVVAERVFARDADWVVPPLLRSELRNVLLQHHRAGKLTAAGVIEAERCADALLHDRAQSVDGAHVLALGLPSSCTAYDCEFVALAEALDVPLVTWDRAVLRQFPERAVVPDRFVDGA